MGRLENFDLGGVCVCGGVNAASSPQLMGRQHSKGKRFLS